MWKAVGGGRSVGSVLLSACLSRCIRAVPPSHLVARLFHLMARSIGAARCRALMSLVWVRRRSCPAVRHPVLPDCLLRELVKTAREEAAFLPSI